MESTMNLLSKTAPWVMASLVTAVSVFGQTNSKNAPPAKNMNQGEELMPNQYMAAYNAPARIDVRGAWDFYGTATFTYWQASQDNMELGTKLNVTDVSSDPAVTSQQYLDMNFGFKPGFKVALGMNFDHDNWDSQVVYAWFRGTSESTTTLDASNTNFFILPNFGGEVVDANDRFTSAKETWRLHMDLLDWELARSYYNGTSLTFRPFVALRGAWIREYMTETSTGTNAVTNPGSRELVARAKANSWAVGPRVGIATNWLLGEGFRLFGNGAGDILYTRYTSLGEKSQETGILTATNLPIAPTLSYYSQRDLGLLRPHLELELGFGWGTYFDNNNWHVDLTAGYGFQVFFDQNMFRTSGLPALGTSFIVGPELAGNLYVQGLNVSARFDF